MKKIYLLITAVLISNGLFSQTINFPDPVFKALLLSNSPGINPVAFDQDNNYIVIDANSDGEIDQSEATVVHRMQLSGLSLSDITGIQYFTNLKKLNITGINAIAQVDVSTLPGLEELNISNSPLLTNLIPGSGLTELHATYCALSTLDVSECPNLQRLHCNNNQLTALDLSNNLQLQVLQCFNNMLAALEVSFLTDLTELRCQDNQLALLDIENLSLLEILNCSNNQIAALDASNKIYLSNLDCSGNSMVSLDVSGFAASYPQNAMVWINCSNNNLQTLNLNTIAPGLNHQVDCGFNPNLTEVFIKTGSVFSETLSLFPPPLPGPGLHFQGCTALTYICAEEINFSYIQQKILAYNLPQCAVNDYCTFMPGGTFYIIAGTVRLDSGNDGCGTSDPVVASQKFTIEDEGSTRTFFTQVNGNYQAALFEGTSTVTPVFETPGYFVSSPASTTASFPQEASPLLQNFCFAANGPHPDVEITLLPLNTAIPGFDVLYKMTFKNKGTTIENGTLSLAFDDSVLDVVAANPNYMEESFNLLTWQFSNLLPFETRTINLIFNLNSPVETPAVNSGDVLVFNGSIAIPFDEQMIDNEFRLSQLVFNSFDPNDIICLEGNTVGPDKIGGFVNYMIRFENTGTFAAQNIVIKDDIDLEKFDINSLQPVAGSHPFETRISSGNKVEFIFENIQLPFDDQNNDGYVAFKIKTLPSLQIGDTFSNSAAIYFDFNFPIVTNTATTTIQALDTGNAQFSKHFTLYPNPVSEYLQIKSMLAVTSVEITNSIGQVITTIGSYDSKPIDVSSLNSGVYLIKITSSQGTSVGRFIKI